MTPERLAEFRENITNHPTQTMFCGAIHELLDEIDRLTASLAEARQEIDPVQARRTAAVLALGEMNLALARDYHDHMNGDMSLVKSTVILEALAADDAARTEADHE